MRALKYAAWFACLACFARVTAAQAASCVPPQVMFRGACVVLAECKLSQRLSMFDNACLSVLGYDGPSTCSKTYVGCHQTAARCHWSIEKMNECDDCLDNGASQDADTVNNSLRETYGFTGFMYLFGGITGCQPMIDRTDYQNAADMALARVKADTAYAKTLMQQANDTVPLAARALALEDAKALCAAILADQAKALADPAAKAEADESSRTLWERYH